MNAFATFLKTTALGGFLVLLPILLLYLALSEVVHLVVGLATPIADLFPKGTFDKVNAPLAVALVILLSASFVLGLAARAEPGRRLGRWVEQKTLARLPLYQVLKGLGTRLAEIEQGTLFKPAVLVSADGQKELAYLIEEHADGSATIMLPWAPTPLSGSVKIVRGDQVRLLDATLGEMTRVLGHWGVGTAALLRTRREARAR